MKKLFQVCAVLMFSFTANAQLQNLDFENWDEPVDFSLITMNTPTGWQNCSRLFGYEEAFFNYRFFDPVDTIPFSNNYAIKLFNWYSYMKDAAVQTASIDYRPVALKGSFKYIGNLISDVGVDITDTAQVLVALTKWNPTLSKTDTIGFGHFETAEATSVFTTFQATIVYNSPEIPDSITILLDPSIVSRTPESMYMNYSLENFSTFIVDDLSLVNQNTAGKTTGIADISTRQVLQLYPNPAGNQIQIEQRTGDVSIMDLTGKVMLSDKLNNQSSLDISALNPGVFMVRVQNTDGVFTGKLIKQ